MKKFFLLSLIFIAMIEMSFANEVGNAVLETKNNKLVLEVEKGKTPKLLYLGVKTESNIQASPNYVNTEIYPAFGIQNNMQHAIQVTHADGNMSLELVVDKTEVLKEGDIETLIIYSKDKVYPFYVKSFYRSYPQADVFETWTEIQHAEKGNVFVFKAFSAYLNVPTGNQYLLKLHGPFIHESHVYEFPLSFGITQISSKEGVRNTNSDNPSFMISYNGKFDENQGQVLGGALSYTGNYKITFEKKSSARVDNQGVSDKSAVSSVDIVAGYNEEASHYLLKAKEVFATPKFIFTYTADKGKGQITRNFHKWALKYDGIYGAKKVNDILLNSWEGVYFNTRQDNMSSMMNDFAALGGELFVMDDGWFGDKYPRNDGSTSLGDWVTAKSKLPQGVDGLVKEAVKSNIKFGIWIEPEMINSKSELFEKHPEWVIQLPNRETVKGRGKTQMTLDLSNPKVQDFVFKVVDDLMTNYPQIAYIKWDANHYLSNYGSTYLPANKQSHLYIEYHRGFESVLKRIRSKYPNVVMQSCASGGGRVTYGHLRYFDEYWTSDNTDAFHRIFIQNGISHFYPVKGMASHVSAAKNHQTGRVIPLKFRFDVAMSGRLGMEMVPADFNEEEKNFAIMAITNYKQIRDLVQFGELYRGISPQENNGLASLTYVTEDKNQAVFFAYNPRRLHGEAIPAFRIYGLDTNKKYKVTEINYEDNKPRFVEQIITGSVLVNNGLALTFMNTTEYASVILKIDVVK